jgi:phosphoribosylformylglycinamidine (FGAM) synthase PurS component
MEDNVTVHVELNDTQAWALAQMLKRLGWNDCRELAE